MAANQMNLAEAFLDPRMGLRGKLKGLSEIIDWAPLASLAARVRPGEEGRPPYPALAMLKALYLAALYDLSDPGLEEALIDRVSFRLFCGFSLEERTPDETTLLRFRHDCVAAGVWEAAFAQVNRQLEAQGLMVKKGTLMDATIIAAASASRRTSGKIRPLRRPMQPRRGRRRRLRWPASRELPSPARAARVISAIGCMSAPTRDRDWCAAWR